jgi:hypothetical protein
MHDHHSTPMSADERLLGRLTAAAEPSAPSEHEVARLRRRVRRAVAAETAEPRGFAARGLMLAASAAVAVASLVFVAGDGWQPGSTAAAKASPTFTITAGADGQVEFEFHDGRARHTIVRSEQPEGCPEAVVRAARGGRFVDHDVEQEPGTVVFYRID